MQAEIKDLIASRKVVLFMKVIHSLLSLSSLSEGVARKKCSSLAAAHLAHPHAPLLFLSLGSINFFTSIVCQPYTSFLILSLLVDCFLSSPVTWWQGTPDFPMCGFSNKAVQILDFHRTQYGAFNVLEDTEVREGVKQFS